MKDNLQASRIVGGNTAYKRAASDFYPTPPDVTIALMEFLELDPGTRIWEPACGEGHMVRAMEAMGYQVIGTDIQQGNDFLIVPPVDCEWILPLTWRPDFLFKTRGKGSPLMDVMWVVWEPGFDANSSSTGYVPLDRPKTKKEAVDGEND